MNPPFFPAASWLHGVWNGKATRTFTRLPAGSWLVERLRRNGSSLSYLLVPEGDKQRVLRLDAAQLDALQRRR